MDLLKRETIRHEPDGSCLGSRSVDIFLPLVPGFPEFLTSSPSFFPGYIGSRLWHSRVFCSDLRRSAVKSSGLESVGRSGVVGRRFYLG